jgi:hypothetical protein
MLDVAGVCSAGVGWDTFLIPFFLFLVRFENLCSFSFSSDFVFGE